jgi:diacylglycerol kinase family enzyme
MIGVILNPGSGYVRANGVDSVCTSVREKLPDAQVHVLDTNDDVGNLVREFLAQGANCVAALGGDGTMNSVAASLIDTGTPLGVIPGGTLNHFARDVGVGRDVPAALDILAAGHTTDVDVATVNDKLILNNSSIGLYPQMVQLRERYERRLGKWRAMLRAGMLVLRDARSMTVTVNDGSTTHRVRTYLVFIGNNQYEVNLLHLGRRQRLDGGELSCFIVEVPTRVRLAPAVFTFLRDRELDERMLATFTVSRLTVTPVRNPEVNVSADGEVFRLRSPLEYRIRPRALKVIVPEPPPPESRAARDAVQGEDAQSDASMLVSPGSEES